MNHSSGNIPSLHRERVTAFRSQLSDIFYDLARKCLVYPDQASLLGRYRGELTLIKDYDALLLDQVLPLFFDRFDRYVEGFDGDTEKARSDIQGIVREYASISQERARREIDISSQRSTFSRSPPHLLRAYKESSDMFLRDYFETMVLVVNFTLHDLAATFTQSGEALAITTREIEKILRGVRGCSRV